MRIGCLRAALLSSSLAVAVTSGTAASAETKTVKIAYEGALTGQFAFFGVPIGNAVQLAVGQAKDELARGGIDLQYAPADDQLDPAQAPAVARKIIGDPAVIGVVGPLWGNTTNAAGPLYMQAHMAMLTMGTAAALATKGWTIFRVVPNDDLQAAAVADYLVKKLKATKIAVIDDATQYGHGLGEAAKAQVKKDGGQVVAEEAIDPNADDYSSTISKLMTNGADAVFLGASVNTETVFNRQLREAGFKGAFFAPDGSLSPDYVKLAGPGSEGTYFTCQCAPVPAYGGPASGPLADFVAAYQKQFNASPQAYSAEGYDSANMIIAAIRAGVRDPAALVDYLRSHPYIGTTRTYQFQANGEPVGATINIYQIKGGKIAWLGTTDDLMK
jgi:branched-chain amino acid transport system substrate-binding protein